jgi:hypothetical protein
MMRRMLGSAFGRLAFATVLIVALGGCTIYLTDGEASVRTSVRGRITFGVPLDDVITRFTPTRGVGASYRVGDPIAFDVRTTNDGYLTLTSIDPDGFVHTFARNISVRGGVTQTIEGPDSRHIFTVDPPRGLLRIRASFTSGRTDTSRVTYRGQRGEDAWTQSISVEVRPYDVRDVVETHIYVR